MLNKINKEPAYNDKLIVIEDNGTADIATIYDRDDIKIYAESSKHEYNIPLADCKAFVGSLGRIYVLQANSEYISDTKRLAALEQSIVLRQVTHFEKEREQGKKRLDLKQILLYVMIAVLLMAVIFK